MLPAPAERNVIAAETLRSERHVQWTCASSQVRSVTSCAASLRLADGLFEILKVSDFEFRS
jgi:hypothetical protein